MRLLRGGAVLLAVATGGCKSQKSDTPIPPPPPASTAPALAAAPSSRATPSATPVTSAAPPIVPVAAPANAFLAKTLITDNCALTAKGQAYCWGGKGKKAIRREPDFDGVTALASGRFYLYLLTSKADLLIFGAGLPGNPDNPRFDRPSPAPSGWNHLEELRGSAFAVCGREVNGDVRCASEHENPGDAVEGLEPAKMADLGGVVALDVGEKHACAVLGSGEVKCWGQGRAGELGRDVTSDSEKPISVEGLSDAKSVCTGAQFSCALSRDGTVSCWGRNSTHALGPGRPDGGPKPEKVPGAIGVTQLSCTDDRVYARTSSGGILTWGSPDKSKSDAGTVRTIPGAESIVEIQAANEGYCARQTGGSVWCWGEAHVGWAGTAATDASGRPLVLTK